ncbi:VARLMGL domain-containing protein [Gossypium australe]|uniref:VARLMGL domain-containing protein n=1 Tax=Gossypium australe TaxID=47621 RepID=A0A5B6V3P0_9ROSI|nr:VARLMGL domain-containing protein [Gossypium australe]
MRNTKSSSSGCFSAVFRRLFCSGSPQTHPSDPIIELNAVDIMAKAQVQASESGPGIVARLMGLDTLPDNNWVCRAKTPSSVPRSKSVNFMDYMLDFDLTKATHRQVKTSTSFQELPQSPQLLQHNQETMYEPRKWKSQRVNGSSGKNAKQNVNVREKVRSKKKNKKISKLKNEPRRVSSKQSLKSSGCIVKKVEYTDSNSEGSSSSLSPVSVLFVNDFESTKNEETAYFMELVDRPSKMTDEDIKLSNWITNKLFTFEDFEEICVKLEEQILDLMLHQVADELVGFHTWNV